MSNGKSYDSNCEDSIFAEMGRPETFSPREAFAIILGLNYWSPFTEENLMAACNWSHRKYVFRDGALGAC